MLISLGRSYCRIEQSGKAYRAKEGYEKCPVGGVYWYGANSYAQFYDKRLPTEAEWEKAARGIDGRIYPWGDEAPDETRANFGGSVGDTTPVGKYLKGASPYGVLDMAGNVWEWCSDWYDNEYYKKSPKRNPQGPESGKYRVCRSGSWLDNPILLRCARRNRLNPLYSYFYLGFRCVVSSPSLFD